MGMMETIADFIQKQLDVLGEVDEEEQIGHIVDTVNYNYDGAQCKYFYAGGFDSPGYDIDCYVIAYLEEGTIKGIDVQIERY